MNTYGGCSKMKTHPLFLSEFHPLLCSHMSVSYTLSNFSFERDAPPASRLRAPQLKRYAALANRGDLH